MNEEIIKSVVQEMIINGEIRIEKAWQTKETNEGWAYQNEVIVLGTGYKEQSSKLGCVIKDNRPRCLLGGENYE